MPFARATGMGSTAAWADHSKSVCRRQSSTISSPLIVSVVVVIFSRTDIPVCLCVLTSEVGFNETPRCYRKSRTIDNVCCLLIAALPGAQASCLHAAHCHLSSAYCSLLTTSRTQARPSLPQTDSTEFAS